MTEQDDNALDAASGYTLPNALDPALMTEPNPLEEVGGFSLHALTPDDVPDDTTPPTVPDHKASRDPQSIIDRVRNRTREDGGKTDAKTAPKKTAAKKKTPPPKTRDGQLVEALEGIYTAGGMALIPFDATCGMAVISNAHQCAVSLDKLAQQNDAVRRVLLAMTEASAWGGVVAAHLPLLLIVVTHHASKDVAERLAPVAMMMNPDMMQAPAQDSESGDAA